MSKMIKKPKNQKKVKTVVLNKVESQKAFYDKLAKTKYKHLNITLN